CCMSTFSFIGSHVAQLATLSLRDALPIWLGEALDDLERAGYWVFGGQEVQCLEGGIGPPQSFPVAILQVLRSTNPTLIKISPDGDRKSTRLNSSHVKISYAVFCLKKKRKL